MSSTPKRRRFSNPCNSFLLFVSRNFQGRLFEPSRVIKETNKVITQILQGARPPQGSGAKIASDKNWLQSDLPILKKIAAYVVQSGGKRIRPLFLYYLGRAHNLDGAELIRLGALLEIVHAASLLHDDVVDGAEERRSQPSGAKLFGNKQVVLGGDHLLSSGLKYLNSLGNPLYMRIFTDSIQALSEAELLQMHQHFKLKTDLKVHSRIVDGKTATLFRAAGALVAVQNEHADFYGADTAVLGALFGRYFQYRDDYLDYFESARLKKRGLQDFTNGIVTRPLAMLLKVATKSERSVIVHEWDYAREHGHTHNQQKILHLMQVYEIEKQCRAILEADEQLILRKLGALPGKEAREVIAGEFQKILAVRAG